MRPDQHKRKQSAKYKKKHCVKHSEGNISADQSNSQDGQKGYKKYQNQRLSLGDKRAEFSGHPEQSDSSRGGFKKTDENSQQEEEFEAFRRRQVLSNWDRYEERALEEKPFEARGADFSQLLSNAGDAVSQFRLKAEAEWDAEITEEDPSSALSLDVVELAVALQCVPLHQRLRIPRHLFQEKQLVLFNKDAADSTLQWQADFLEFSQCFSEAECLGSSAVEELAAKNYKPDPLDDILNDVDDSISNRLPQPNTKTAPGPVPAITPSCGDMDQLNDLLNMDNSGAVASLFIPKMEEDEPDDLDDLLSRKTSSVGPVITMVPTTPHQDGSSSVFKPAVTEDLDAWLDSMLDD